MKKEVYASKEDWLAARRTLCTASDVAAVLGLHPWRSALEVYADKVGILPDKEETESMYWGEPMEGPIAARYEQETGRRTHPMGGPGHRVLCRSEKYPWLGCTPDRLIDAHDGRGRGVLQIKTTGPGMAAEWEDEPPVTVQSQVQTEMRVLEEDGIEYGSVAVLIWRPKFLWCDLEPHRVFQEMVITQTREFMDRVRERRPPDPDASDSARRALATLYAEPAEGVTIALGADAYDWHLQREEAKQAIKEQEERKAEADNHLKGLIGEAEKAILPGNVIYTLKRKEEVFVEGYLRKAYRELRVRQAK